MALKTVAIVGRPNVGKSALFNRIARANRSIVHSETGVTRDRLYAEVEWTGKAFRLVDTGGLLPGAEDDLTAAISHQVKAAIAEADELIFVVDGSQGVTPVDQDIAQILRESGKTILVAVNKCDIPRHKERALEFYTLGFSEVFPVSALHGLGVAELMDWIVRDIEASSVKEAPEDDVVRVAVVGKPNVGKSSLVNALLGQERMTVAPVPGTTVDAVDTPFLYDGEPYVLIDTAGLRRPARVERELERLSVARSLAAVKRAHCVVVMVSANEMPVSQDRRIAGYVLRSQKASVIVVNKVDLGILAGASRKKFSEVVRSVLYPIAHSRILFVSCLTGEGVGDVLPAVRSAYREYSRRVGTSLINDVLREACEIMPPPGKVKILYGTQVDVRPPKVVLFTKGGARISAPYLRYLEGRFRGSFGFEGSPIVFEQR
ncbi:MAG TPA: ribosome biogenesis GTPase Der [Firmicutes bacterium]|nr:ribosome biogenesis GTPase Der [Candidatus Fermentithermobacillaceae bacterium]